jgi:hypothetical protein
MVWTLTVSILLACGSERWPVKTMADAAASEVSTTAARSTVAQLTGLAAPKYGAHEGRAPEERVLYEVTAYVLGFKTEEDGDLHVVIADSPRSEILHDRKSGHGSRGTMVAELPSDECTAGSTQRDAQSAARAAFLKLAGAPPEPGRFKRLRRPLRLVLQGVAFFDKDHGQTGRGANVIELHPVLAVTTASP